MSLPSYFQSAAGEKRSAWGPPGEKGARVATCVQDMDVACCPTVARGLIVEMKLLLALTGVLVTLILAQPCEGTASGNSPLDRQGEEQWRGNAWV